MQEIEIIFKQSIDKLCKIVSKERHHIITNLKHTHIMKNIISVAVVTSDNITHIEQIKSSHPSPISQAMTNVAYKYRKAGKGSPTILKAY